MASYAKRRAVADAAEWVYQIDPQGFFVRDAKGVVQRAHWTDIVELRLGAAPLKDQPGRHLTRVVHRNGAHWDIDNQSVVSAAEVQDRSADYAPFIGALLAKLRQTTPYARVMRGHTLFGYWSIVAAIGSLLALGALAVIAVPVEGGSPLVVGLAKLGLLFMLVVPVASWLAELKPKGVRVGQAPESALPPAVAWKPPTPVVPPAAKTVALAPPEDMQPPVAAHAGAATSASPAAE